MFTSYYANKNVVNPVSISLMVPKWFVGNHYPKLAPPSRPNLVLLYKGGEIDKYEYEELYKKHILNKLNCKDVYDEICFLFGEDATLLCYETPNLFCHRQLVSQWFKTIGKDVPEFGIPKLKKLWD